LRLVLFILLLTNYSVFSAELDARFLHTIAKIESNNNPKAYNPKRGEIGLYQITPICYKDVQRINPYFKKFPHKKCYDPAFSLSVLKVYLKHWEPTAYKNNDLTSLARCWNGGSRWRTKRWKTDKYVKRFWEEYLTK